MADVVVVEDSPLVSETEQSDQPVSDKVMKSRGMPTKQSKDIRTRLTGGQKGVLCDHKRTNPKLTQPDLIAWTKSKFGVTLSQPCVSSILKDREKYLRLFESETNKSVLSTKTHHKFQHPGVQERLWQ